MGFPKSQMEVNLYTMSMHIGVCAYGEGIELVAITYGEKEVWRGSKTAAETFAVRKTDLYGGLKKEGGVAGLVWWLPGAPDQVLPETLAAKRGLTGATSPAYRGLASIYLTGGTGVLEPELDAIKASLSGSGALNKKGFYLGANNPYLRPFKVRIRRPSIGLDPDYAMIRIPDDSNGNAQYASNPAHMTYECFTNKDWGMGENPAVIDKASFEAAAVTLYEEGFGLNMIWSRQSEIAKFVGEIMTHIRGAVYVNPSTGKHTMKLLRGDYDADLLPTIDPNNAQLSNFKRKTWGDIANEVVVTYTNAETGKDSTVTVQDLAGIAAEGGLVSSGQNYYAIPYQELAIAVAERDLAAAVNPIATCEAVVTREFWNTVSSDVLRLSWPEYNIAEIVFRVSEVNKEGNKVNLSLYEDIFGLDRASYLTPGDTGWTNPSQAPTPATYYRVGTLPAFLMTAALGLNDPSEFEYPEALSSLVVGADSDDDVNFDLVTYQTDVNGITAQQNLGSRPYRGTWVLLDGLAAEESSVLPSLPGLRGVEPTPGCFVVIGSTTDAYSEIATVQSVDEDGYHLNRGMLDTVPRTWAAGTRAFVIPPSTPAADTTVRAVTEDVSYWLLPRTTKGVLPLADAPQINVTLSARPYSPTRPANVKVNGTGFGAVDASAATGLLVTWARRNRVTEAAQALKWNDADVSPEIGQSTTVTVTDEDGVPIVIYSGITGTSKMIPLSVVYGHDTVFIKVKSVRDGFESLQSYALIATSFPSFEIDFSEASNSQYIPLIFEDI